VATLLRPYKPLVMWAYKWQLHGLNKLQ
jgi:hypothetical protein